MKKKEVARKMNPWNTQGGSRKEYRRENRFEKHFQRISGQYKDSDQAEAAAERTFKG